MYISYSMIRSHVKTYNTLYNHVLSSLSSTGGEEPVPGALPKAGGAEFEWKLSAFRRTLCRKCSSRGRWRRVDNWCHAPRRKRWSRTS